MSIWNKILIGLIGVASVALFYTAARTMKTHQHWRQLAADFEKKIAQVEKDNKTIAEGTEKAADSSEMGIRQLRLELSKLLQDRRRAWFNCTPKVKVDREKASASITVVTDQPELHGITQNTVLYAFEEIDVQKKGRYLGEFKVTKADEKQKTAVLVPTSLLSPREIEKLAGAKQPWELYEVMPRDNHDIFASLSDDEKKAMLPASVLPEYRDEEKRPLNDYQILFDAGRTQRTLLLDKIDYAQRDAKLLEAAVARAKEMAEKAEKEVASTKEDAKMFGRERDAVASYLKTIQKELDAAKAVVAELIKKNKAMAGQIAKLQFEAARRIDQRTRAMAQSGAGG